MKLLYQGLPGAYSHLACEKIKKHLDVNIDDIVGVSDFTTLWKQIDNQSIGIIPIENSYAGNIHENLYNFLRYDYKIIGTLYFEVNHCLLSHESSLDDITSVHSHTQALHQCHSYLKNKHIEPIPFSDTAGAAEMIGGEKNPGTGAIASSLAGEIYGLNILDKNIQDQNGNTTHFIVVVPQDSNIQYSLNHNKTSIIFEAKNIPASLYKCLGAFATNNVNLTKIESLPSTKGNFSYLFWIVLEGNPKDKNVEKSLAELAFFTHQIRILGEY